MMQVKNKGADEKSFKNMTNDFIPIKTEPEFDTRPEDTFSDIPVGSVWSPDLAHFSEIQNRWNTNLHESGNFDDPSETEISTHDYTSEFMLFQETPLLNAKKARHRTSRQLGKTCHAGSLPKPTPDPTIPPTDQFTCYLCNKTFHRASALNLHFKIHTGDRPFECDLCGKRFYKSGDVKRHRIYHLGVKPHKCPACEKCFNDRSNMTRHLRTCVQKITDS